MMTAVEIIVALIFAIAAAPLGLLPSILLFRDLADGNSVGPAVERRYTMTLWAGLVSAITFGACVGVAVVRSL